MNVFNSPSIAAAGSALANVHGRQPANLRRFHTALARLRAGTYRPRILFVGDSKTMGAGAGTDAASAGTVGAAARSMTRYFADRLAERGWPVTRQSIVGLSGLTTPGAQALFDPRMSPGAGWTAGNGIWLSAGGSVFLCPNGVSSSLTFAPADAVDRLDVYSFKGAAVGEFTVSEGGTVRATIDGNAGGLSFGKQTVALSGPGTGKTLSIARTATRALEIYIAGLIAYDSTKPAIDILNAGWFGSKTADWTGAAYPWSPLNAIPVYAPDLTVVALGANDMSAAGGTAVSVFRSQMQTLIDKAKATGDVVLVVETFGARPGWGDAATQEAYRQTILGLGTANGCMVVDQAARFGGFVEANALGLFFDTIHETAPGYADQAQALAKALLF